MYPPLSDAEHRLPVNGSGQQKRRGRPYSATVHNDQEGNGPTPATARHK
ncbi:MAG: hypothetical protein ACI9HB_002260 [Gammaproteobacteria bacterium]|jgi:hypothetical protein